MLKSDNAYKSTLETARNYENIGHGYYYPSGSVLIIWKLIVIIS